MKLNQPSHTQHNESIEAFIRRLGVRADRNKGEISNTYWVFLLLHFLVTTHNKLISLLHVVIYGVSVCLVILLRSVVDVVSLILCDGKCFDWISILVSEWVEVKTLLLVWVSSFLRYQRFDAYYICDCYCFYFQWLIFIHFFFFLI